MPLDVPIAARPQFALLMGQKLPADGPESLNCPLAAFLLIAGWIVTECYPCLQLDHPLADTEFDHAPTVILQRPEAFVGDRAQLNASTLTLSIAGNFVLIEPSRLSYLALTLSPPGAESRDVVVVFDMVFLAGWRLEVCDTPGCQPHGGTPFEKNGRNMGGFQKL
jgi:hypothetical protein